MAMKRGDFWKFLKRQEKEQLRKLAAEKKRGYLLKTTNTACWIRNITRWNKTFTLSSPFGKISITLKPGQKRRLYQLQAA